MANSTIIQACTREGLALFNKPGTLPEWLPPRRALEGQGVIAAWGQAGPPITLLAVAEGELLRSESGGRSWLKVAVESYVTAMAAADDPTVVYAATKTGSLIASRDAGASWETLPPTHVPGEIYAIYPDTKSPGRLFLLTRGADMCLLEGDPAAGEWHPLPACDMDAIDQDPASGDLYIAGPEGLRISTDGGINWGNMPGTPRNARALLVVEGPAGKPPAILAGTENGIAHSQDGGLTWQYPMLPQSRPGGVTALAHDPERRDRLYAGTGEGYLFESSNRGQAWQSVNSSPVAPVVSLHIIRI